MLYDILIVDDALNEDILDDVLQILKETKETNTTMPPSDSSKVLDAFNIHQLLCQLLRDNLRVTWTTGESDDLDELSETDLSSIRYIFLDLELKGVNISTGYKNINSKVMGIFNRIDTYMQKPTIKCLINSKYGTSENYGDEGLEDLKKKLNEKFKQKYSVEVVEEKSTLSSNQKKELQDNLLLIHAKTLIINKALDVEKIFDKKLGLSDSAKERVNFNSKHLVFQSQFLSDDHKELKKEIQLLQQIRNTLAHTENDLESIKDKDIRKTFWKILSRNEEDKAIEFESFKALTTYLDSVSKLEKYLERLIPL